jgi:hypothetical protein
VAEGLIASEGDFDVQTFGGKMNAIHVKTGGGVVVRFGVRGGHQFYDFFRTLGSIYVLARYMHRIYDAYPVSDVSFAYTIIAEQYLDTLPKPHYQGYYEMDVSRDSFSDSATDAILACLREGANPRVTRATVKDDLDKFWAQEFSMFQ